MTERENLAYEAEVCERAERVEEMRTCVQKILAVFPQLNERERLLFSSVNKFLVDPQRKALKFIENLEKKELSKQLSNQQQMQLSMIKEIKSKLEKDLQKTCFDVIESIDDKLIANATEASAKVFFKKMIGDYYRYLAESSRNKSFIQESADAYAEAWTMALRDLEPIDLTRLSLALNGSIFFYEIEGNPKLAYKTAKDAFDEAILDIDGLKEGNEKTPTIMHQLRENFTLWKNEVEDFDEEDS